MPEIDPAARLPASLRPLLDHPVTRAFRAAAGDRPAHWVGGLLRDLLLGRLRWNEGRTAPAAAVSENGVGGGADWDGVVAGGEEAGGGEAVARELARRLDGRFVRLGGDRFAALRVVTDEVTVDLWDRGRASLASDLARRDVTVNALALDLHSGELVDPFGGLADLGARRLRAVTEKSFRGDPLRVLRLVRLAVVLEMAADPETTALARASAGRVPEMASERIREELRKTFRPRRAGAGREALAGLIDVDLYPSLWETPAGGTAAVGAALHSTAVRWMEAAEEAQEEACGAAEPLLLRWAATLLPFPDPARAAEQLVEAGYLKPRRGRQLKVLLALPLPSGERERRHFLHAAGKAARDQAGTAEALATAAALAGARAREAGDERWLREEEPALRELADREGEALAHPPRWLSGGEVGELLGIDPGPEIGEALAALTLAQVEGRVTSREEAESFVRALRSAGA